MAFQINSSDNIKGVLAKKTSGLSKFACCIPLGRRKKNVFEQCLVILRHSERADYADKGWKKSEEGLAWPSDAPLTVPKGIDLAKTVAEELLKVHEEFKFTAICCSPFRRCVETAAQVSKRLELPMLIDVELGEIWDTSIPKEPLPHRSPLELRNLLTDLEVKCLNPILEDGSLKMFGKPPLKWPETLDDARSRYVVRIENYISQSIDTRQNFIVVTHADCVAAVLQLLERGNADVQQMDFCAQVTAKRQVDIDKVDEDKDEHGVYGAKWNVKFTRAGVELMGDDGTMAKYYEKMHLETCQETEDQVTARKNRRTNTDFQFANALLATAGATDEDEEDVEESDQGTLKPETDDHLEVTSTLSTVSRGLEKMESVKEEEREENCQSPREEDQTSPKDVGQEGVHRGPMPALRVNSGPDTTRPPKPKREKVSFNPEPRTSEGNGTP